jgi:CRP-like cAMP-binding protein
MAELLLQSIREKVSATDEELLICKSFFTPKKLKKKQFLLQEGDVCNRMTFVESGALFSYATNAKGAQNVIQVAFEGWWISDLYSFFTQEPSTLNIEVLEDAELLMIDREQHEYLLARVPKYETYIRLLYQNAYIALQRRVESTIGLTAEEKYIRLLEQYPSILQRMPLNLVASYLGVTPETLSRIRKQISL